MKDERVHLRFILQAAEKIIRYSADLDFKMFAENEEKQSAIIMQLVVIGELAKRLSEKEKTKVPLPWEQIAGFRNMAVHEYFKLDLGKIWKTIQDDIPHLIKESKSYL